MYVARGLGVLHERGAGVADRQVSVTADAAVQLVHLAALRHHIYRFDHCRRSEMPASRLIDSALRTAGRLAESLSGDDYDVIISRQASGQRHRVGGAL